MSFNFDRRTFLKGAGAVGAASLLAACGEKSNNTGNGAAASGAAASGEPLIVNEAPDDGGLAQCRALGAALAGV